TAQLVTLLQNNGAFNTKAWFARCAWSYATSASIPDSETGCGIIPLAGAVIEVFSNNTDNYTIRITTATTTSVSGALAYFHERRSLNNFHRDRVITFEQIAE
ncbi:hypothetical protein ACNF5D_26135, partial [Escherichia coli]